MGSRVAAHGRVPAHGHVEAAHGRGHGRVTFEGVAACWRMALPRHMAVLPSRRSPGSVYFLLFVVASVFFVFVFAGPIFAGPAPSSLSSHSSSSMLFEAYIFARLLIHSKPSGESNHDFIFSRTVEAAALPDEAALPPRSNTQGCAAMTFVGATFSRNALSTRTLERRCSEACWRSRRNCWMSSQKLMK